MEVSHAWFQVHEYITLDVRIQIRTVDGTLVVQLKKALYGLVESSELWFQKLVHFEVILNFEVVSDFELVYFEVILDAVGLRACKA